MQYVSIVIIGRRMHISLFYEDQQLISFFRRKELLKEKKLLIGSLASAFLEDPHERISNLETLVKLVDGEQPESVKFSVQRLAAASVLEVLKAGLNILSLNIN